MNEPRATQCQDYKCTYIPVATETSPYPDMVQDTVRHFAGDRRLLTAAILYFQSHDGRHGPALLPLRVVRGIGSSEMREYYQCLKTGQASTPLHAGRGCSASGLKGVWHWVACSVIASAGRRNGSN